MSIDFNKRTLLELFPNNTTQLTEAYLTDVNYVTEKITEERTRAEAAEAQLQANIDAEEARAEAAEETLQANIDAEEARAIAAEVLKEDKANKVTSTGTYVSDDTHYASTKAVDARIAEISPKEIEWATYGTTTYSKLNEWYTAGKFILCKKESAGQVYIYKLSRFGSNVFYFERCELYPGTGMILPLSATCDNTNTWTSYSKNLETTDNKLASSSTWSSNDTKYPTTAAVDARIDAKVPGSQVEWATIGTTTYNQIKSWNDAGKLVLCKNTTSGPVDQIMKLTICTPGGAFFCGVQGTSLYTAEVNPANQWQTNSSSLQGFAMHRSYETWDDTNDNKYPSLKAVSEYVAGAGGGIEWAVQDETSFETIKGWHDAGKLVVLKNDSDYFAYLDTISNSSATFTAIDDYYGFFGATVDSDDNWNTWWDEMQTTGSMLPSTSTWSSDDIKYPTTAAVDARIAAISPKEIEWAHNNNQPNTTSFATMRGWLDSGKAVMMNVGGTIYMVIDHNSAEIRFSAVYYATNDSAPEFLDYLVTSSNVWTFNSYRLETLNNKLASTSSWTSNNTKYPTTAAVDARIDAKVPGSQVAWAQGNETNATLKSWHDAGKIVLRHVTGGSSAENGIYRMTHCTSSSAHFDLVMTAQLSGSPETYSLAYISVSSNVWSSGSKTIQFENASNRTKSTDTWVSADYAYPSNKAVENYVAAHSGSDVYEILGGDTLQIPCRKLDYDQSNQDYRVILGAAGNVYGPRVNVRFTKNGERLTIGSNQWVKINPYSTDGSNTWISGRMINAPTSSWGSTSASAGADMTTLKPFGIGFNLSNSGITNDTVYVRYPADTEITDWALANSFFVMELYDKNVSQTVPVARKVFQIQPELIEDTYKIQEHMVVEVPVKGKYASNTGWTRGDNSSGALCSIMPYAINRSGNVVDFSMWHGSNNSDEVTILDSTLISSTDNTTHIKIDAMSSTGTSMHSLSLGFNGTFKFTDGDKNARPALYIKWMRNGVFIGGTYIYIVPIPGSQFPV